MIYAVVLVVLVVLVSGGALIALGWQASGRAIHPGSAGERWSLPGFPSLEPEAVTVRSSTGVTLSGRFFAGSAHATIVLSHGYGGTQDEMLPVASALHEAGFSVFSYDLRGCGRSGGEVTFGAREQDDLISVVDYLATRDDVDPKRIGALGFSMGGATTLLAAAREPRIRAVVADSAWSDVHHWLRPSVRATFLHPRDRFTALSLKLAELRTGIDLDRLRPVDQIARISPRAILLIHGSADEVVPPGDSEQNRAAAEPNVELWRVAEATHGETIAPGGPATTERMTSFFERVFLPQTALS